MTSTVRCQAYDNEHRLGLRNDSSSDKPRRQTALDPVIPESVRGERLVPRKKFTLTVTDAPILSSKGIEEVYGARFISIPSAIAANSHKAPLAPGNHKQEVTNMHRSALAVLFIVALATSAVSSAEEVSQEQIKGLDEQIQEIKSDVLGIAAKLSRLEEKLLYPSNSQISLFVSLAPDAKFRLDAVEIQIDGKPAARYLYAYKELEALRQGGVQRIYTGNVTRGEHELQVSVLGKSESGAEYRHTQSFKVNKDIGPRVVGITIAGADAGSQAISLNRW